MPRNLSSLFYFRPTKVLGAVVAWAEFWYNTTFHASTRKTPFEAMYGRQPPGLVRFLPGEVKMEAVRRDLQDRDEALHQLKYHLTKAQGQMKAQADKKRTDHIFEVGEWVFLKLRPHGQQTVGARICPKLAPCYYGPFMILQKVGAVAYKLQLPESARVHPVFPCFIVEEVSRGLQG